jgi:hypothetical protein
VKAIAAEPALANPLEVESSVVVDLFLLLRDVKAHQAMIELYQRMPLPLQRVKMMREQLGFALNRECLFEEAEKALREVIAELGPSSETKRCWDAFMKIAGTSPRNRACRRPARCSNMRSTPTSPGSRPIGATLIPASMP